MAMDWEHMNLINELNQGKQLAEELMKHLNCVSSPETREFLIEKLLSSYEKALSMLNWNGFPVLESPNPDQDPNQKNVFKKRKTQDKYSEQVKVCCGSSLEGPIDDGYNWRKYGQKDILGSKFPRGYYRCRHRHSQGCLAVKQVQKTDEDPSVFEVTYRGRHTCVQLQASHLPITNHKSKQNLINTKTQPQENTEPTKDVFFNTEDLGIFSTLGDFSPATSESNYFSSSSCQFDNFGIGYNEQTPESDLNEIISFPTEDFDFSNFNFDTNFPFPNLEPLV